MRRSERVRLRDTRRRSAMLCIPQRHSCPRRLRPLTLDGPEGARVGCTDSGSVTIADHRHVHGLPRVRGRRVAVGEDLLRIGDVPRATTRRTTYQPLRFARSARMPFRRTPTSDDGHAAGPPGSQKTSYSASSLRCSLSHPPTNSSIATASWLNLRWLISEKAKAMRCSVIPKRY
jgi:hypothetical protein